MFYKIGPIWRAIGANSLSEIAIAETYVDKLLVTKRANVVLKRYGFEGE
jgi:hypothetical protein